MTKLSPSFLRYFIYNNAFISAMDTLAAGALLTAYALALGASPFVIGCLGGLPYIGTLVNVIGAFLVYKGFDVKKVTVGFSFASRPFYLVCAALAIFPVPHAAFWLMIAIALCYLTGGISAGAYYPWLKSLLPDQQTHLFVERKYMASMAAHIMCFLGTFLLMSHWSNGLNNPPISIYAVLFAFAFIFGTLGTGYLLHVPTAKQTLSNVLPAKKQVKQIIMHYKRLLSICAFGLGILLFSNTFVPVFAIQLGNISVTKITALALLGQLCFLCSLPLWKKLNERTFSLSSTLISFCAMSVFLAGLVTSLPWLDKHILYYVSGVFFVIMFIAQAGIKAGLDATILLQAPKTENPVFFAVVSWSKLTAALGPACAGACWTVLRHFHNLTTVTSWQIFFGICLVGCLILAICLACNKNFIKCK